MFSHPALLRELNQLAELLRRAGEGERSREVVQAADELRRRGWTPAGAAALGVLGAGGRLDRVSFGAEHHRNLGGEAGAAAANARLQRHRERLAELASLPLRDAEPGPRQRSPDLP